MNIDFDNDRPIYLQIVELFKMDIIAGNYHANEKLPSVRELSAKYRVNPNTMQRAFADLESLGLVYTERTNGRFVTDKEIAIVSLRKQAAETAVKSFLEYMKKLNFSDEELITFVEEVRKGEHL